jgi:hypothetical protein
VAVPASSVTVSPAAVPDRRADRHQPAGEQHVLARWRDQLDRLAGGEHAAKIVARGDDAVARRRQVASHELPRFVFVAGGIPGRQYRQAGDGGDDRQPAPVARRHDAAGRVFARTHGYASFLSLQASPGTVAGTA